MRLSQIKSRLLEIDKWSLLRHYNHQLFSPRTFFIRKPDMVIVGELAEI